jgi:hypothetical protein
VEAHGEVACAARTVEIAGTDSIVAIAQSEAPTAPTAVINGAATTDLNGKTAANQLLLNTSRPRPEGKGRLL